MLENFNNKNFDYGRLCNETGLSYSYFKELFISKFGMPPVKYLTRLRIEKAKELIITHRYSITEISDMCGFENVYYFSNIFKKYTGVSPSKYTLNI
ncbi:MAG: helix-turn-helix transcriptional regulator [Clostridia bacterium]|nr:helix-turn-helix transcriptional regulator [Clostridia bacterium]